MQERNKNRGQEKVQHVQESNENLSRRHAGNNTQDNQRAADELVKGDKGHQQQGNYGSRQGDGGNRGRRGNRGLE